MLIDREESRARLRDTEQTFLLRGGSPRSVEDTERKLSAYPCAWQVEDPAEEEYPQVPVSLKTTGSPPAEHGYGDVFPACLRNGRPQPLMAHSSSCFTV